MSTDFVSRRIWPQLTKAVRRQRSDVAVAYFGAGASTLLPLTEGSRLVVDASERSVGSGQTCPADLIGLVKHGVAVYSIPNLHAKVFVVGRVAYVGSTNVSSRSAKHLIEAIIRTSDPVAVRDAREFVRQHCLHELTPKVLDRLAKLYRPPLIPGGKRGRKTATASSQRPTIPRVFLVKIHLEHWSERDQALHDKGLLVAKKLRKHPRSFEPDDFRWTGKCPFKRGDVVIQVDDDSGGSALVTPPGNVLHVRSRQDGNRRVSFVYLERPAKRRQSVKAVSRTLGRGAQKRLRRSGLIRDAAFARALLNFWAD